MGFVIIYKPFESAYIITFVFKGGVICDLIKKTGHPRGVLPL